MRRRLPHVFSNTRGPAALVAAVALAALAPPASAADESVKNDAGFTRLFEGDARETWRGYNQDGWPEGWKLEDGILHRQSGGADLITKEQYGDFDLRFGWKISEGGNSGVMYRVSETRGPAYHTGPEYQILDNAAHRDGANALTSAGALYGLYAPSEEAARPAGKWNRGRIVVEDDRVRHFINGKKVVDAPLGSDEWNEKVAKSKFAAWPQFGKNDRGHIALQDHGDEVWYRNIRIKPLDQQATGE